MHDTSADRNPPKQQQRPQRMSSPLVELTIARMKEFLREPEAVFWVFAFPVLMALALGVAFRTQKPADVNAGVLKRAAPARGRRRDREDADRRGRHPRARAVAAGSGRGAAQRRRRACSSCRIHRRRRRRIATIRIVRRVISRD